MGGLQGASDVSAQLTIEVRARPHTPARMHAPAA
jgi:hypothetical protein